MNLTEFKNNSWNSRLWRLKSIFKAMRFAWKHPHHAQISIEDTTENGFLMNANYAGLNERGFLRVLNELGKEAEVMEQTEDAFKEILQ